MYMYFAWIFWLETFLPASSTQKTIFLHFMKKKPLFLIKLHTKTKKNLEIYVKALIISSFVHCS